MSSTLDDPSARLLAEMHEARRLVGRSGAGGVTRSQATAAELWAHARRAPGQSISLTVERQIRVDPVIRLRYRTMLTSQALAHAPLAVAASDGAVKRRWIGAFTLEIVPAEGEAMALLLIRAPSGSTSLPRRIEVMLGSEMLRLDLGEPVAGTVVLALDPSLAEAATLARLVADPNAEVFLL